MKILAIETSCDETGISILDCQGGLKSPKFKLLSHIISSQIDLHKEWGGVVPMLAKREHSKNIVPVLVKALKDAKLYKVTKTPKTSPTYKKLNKILEREPELLEIFNKILPTISIPKIDAITVTQGPGLEPALWVGINFAKALANIWDKPLIPINHMEGHLLSPLAEKKTGLRTIKKMNLPGLGLLISGGHTELVLISDLMKYKVIGQTRDDAIGEAFDKVARILGLPYPGGPEISRLADLWTPANPHVYKLPRPMMNDDNFEFSFSGLKTAVLYLVKSLGVLNDEQKIAIAHEFQTAAIDVMIKKTTKAIDKFGIKSLVIGGGVVSNKELKKRFKETMKKYPEVDLYLPEPKLSTDNATMIGLAGFFRLLGGAKSKTNFKADGNLSL